ncbi:hypothetical protein [Georgenia sunbinii]|uniref:hypothetical protein n=1 Tax=Georgenia sunbinii TaxID=3117728 RepID=UPI002F260B42
MTETVVVLTEDALRPSDARQIVEYFGDRDVTFQVLVPADTERNVFVDVIDALGMLDLREAWEDLTEEPDAPAARLEASESVSTSLSRFDDVGANAEGVVVQDDPLPALVQAVNNHRAAEVVVVTTPKLLSDTLRRDWASRARRELGVPVLHLYTGSSIVG